MGHIFADGICSDEERNVFSPIYAYFNGKMNGVQDSRLRARECFGEDGIRLHRNFSSGWEEGETHHDYFDSWDAELVER